MQATRRYGADRPPTAGAPIAVCAAVLLTACVLLAASATESYGTTTLVAVTGVLGLVAWHRTLLAWPTLLGAVFVVILLIPIRRYTLAGGLGFSLDAYRLMIALLVGVWVLALLVDPKAQKHASGVEPPVILLGFVLLASWLLNIGSIVAEGLWSDVFKTATFFASFFCVMYLTASVISTRRQLDRILMLLVLGGAVVAVCAVVESRTHQNVFNTLHAVMPVLQFEPSAIPDLTARGAGARAYASAEHPIALGAALAMLLPLAIYLYRRSPRAGSQRYLWLAAAALLGTGAMASQSRTAVVMLLAQFAVFLVIRRGATVRLLPLMLPALAVIHLLVPGTLGTIKSAFFPSEGIVSEQQVAISGDGSGRLLKADKALKQWAAKPILGQGFGTRRVSAGAGAKRNAEILDDQWLHSLLEIGALGCVALLWMFGRAARRVGRRAREDDSDTGWLFVGLSAIIISFPVGMLTYDAFSFNQATLLVFIAMGLAAAALRLIPAIRPARAGIG
jgi:O-antigen ligase